MVVKQMAVSRALAITMTRIWQRCSSQCYVDYLKQNQQKGFYKKVNRLLTVGLGLISLALLIAVSIVAWEEVISLTY